VNSNLILRTNTLMWLWEDIEFWQFIIFSDSYYQRYDAIPICAWGRHFFYNVLQNFYSKLYFFVEPEWCLLHYQLRILLFWCIKIGIVLVLHCNNFSYSLATELILICIWARVWEKGSSDIKITKLSLDWFLNRKISGIRKCQNYFSIILIYTYKIAKLTMSKT
jgi:hypothetical protein